MVADFSAPGSRSTVTAAPFRLDWSACSPGRVRWAASACLPKEARNGSATTALLARINLPDLSPGVRRRPSQTSPILAVVSTRHRPSVPARPPKRAWHGAVTMHPVPQRRRRALVPHRPHRASLVRTPAPLSLAVAEEVLVARHAGGATGRRRPIVLPHGRLTTPTARLFNLEPSVPTRRGMSPVARARAQPTGRGSHGTATRVDTRSEAVCSLALEGIRLQATS